MEFVEHVSPAEIEGLVPADFRGVITVVSEQGEEFDRAVGYLKRLDRLGFDTETKPCFVAKIPRNKMAILQLAGPDRAYIFRLQQLGVPAELAGILSDPAILKIGAAVHDDIRGLQEYNLFRPAGFVDLQKMAEAYGIQEKSVRKMAAIILGKRVSKSQQLSNWESSRLSEAQLRYAAVDAWICLEMFDRLREARPEFEVVCFRENEQQERPGKEVPGCGPVPKKRRYPRRKRKAVRPEAGPESGTAVFATAEMPGRGIPAVPEWRKKVPADKSNKTA